VTSSWEQSNEPSGSIQGRNSLISLATIHFYIWSLLHGISKFCSFLYCCWEGPRFLLIRSSPSWLIIMINTFNRHLLFENSFMVKKSKDSLSIFILQPMSKMLLCLKLNSALSHLRQQVYPEPRATVQQKAYWSSASWTTEKRSMSDLCIVFCSTWQTGGTVTNLLELTKPRKLWKRSLFYTANF
jgi:hypothetical protein